jgi:hypothetical protein
MHAARSEPLKQKGLSDRYGKMQIARTYDTFPLGRVPEKTHQPMAQASDPSPERRRRENVQRGLLRAWMVISVLWFLGCIGFYAVLGSDPNLTNAKILTVVAFAVPTVLFALGAAITWVAVGFTPGSMPPRGALNKKRAWAGTLGVALAAASVFTAIWKNIDHEQARLVAQYRAAEQVRQQAELKWEQQQHERANKEREAEEAVAAEKQAATVAEQKKETEVARQLKANGCRFRSRSDYIFR